MFFVVKILLIQPLKGQIIFFTQPEILTEHKFIVLQEIPVDQVNVRDDEELIPVAHFQKVQSRADFHLFKRRGRKISDEVQAAPLSELQQGLGVWVKAFRTK